MAYYFPLGIKLLHVKDIEEGCLFSLHYLLCLTITLCLSAFFLLRINFMALFYSLIFYY